MRLVTFTHAGSTRVGRLEGDEIVDLATAAPNLPTEMVALLAAGGMPAAEAAQGARLPAAEVRLEAPLLRPPKILAVGLNYADHVAETGREPPPIPMIFNKQSTAVTGPGQPIHRPRVSQQLDYEGELAFVVGQRCRHVPRERATEVIAGFTICDDISVRDWQRRSPTLTMGKSFDTHCPLGPALVSADEIDALGGAAAPALRLRTWVNGELRQDSNTKQLIFDCAFLVEHLSTVFTLEPGDVITTGTPSGVAGAMDPPSWLVPGDVVRVEIEGLGALENPVIEEPESTAQRTESP